MRTTIDIPDELLAQARACCGKKAKRDIVCWALEEGVRRVALEELLARRRTVHFDVTPDQLEEQEIKDQYGPKRRIRGGR